MVGIKGINIPKDCVECNQLGLQGALGCQLIFSGCANCGRHPKCPLVEIVTCKECKYYFMDEDGYGYHCEGSDSERIPTCSDWYCIHGERRE